jgi:lipoprotein-releasing system ATP-binding protein
VPVTLRGVGHSWGGDAAPLFRDVSHVFRPGEVCAVVGPSGSGKSTLLAVLAGMLVPAEGVVEHPAGTDVRWVFQNPHGVARRTALDHVSLPFLAAGARRPEADAQAVGLLDEFGLRHRASAPWSQLSGGEAQRLMLARAVASHPDLLLVDEPTAQLDRRTAEQVNASIARLAHRGTAVVVATHDAATRDACTHVLDLGRPVPSGGTA